MNEASEAMIKWLGIIMFVMAVTILLYYVNKYKETYNALIERLIEDTVVL